MAANGDDVKMLLQQLLIHVRNIEASLDGLKSTRDPDGPSQLRMTGVDPTTEPNDALKSGSENTLRVPDLEATSLNLDLIELVRILDADGSYQHQLPTETSESEIPLPKNEHWHQIYPETIKAARDNTLEIKDCENIASCARKYILRLGRMLKEKDAALAKKEQAWGDVDTARNGTIEYFEMQLQREREVWEAELRAKQAELDAKEQELQNWLSAFSPEPSRTRAQEPDEDEPPTRRLDDQGHILGQQTSRQEFLDKLEAKGKKQRDQRARMAQKYGDANVPDSETKSGRRHSTQPTVAPAQANQPHDSADMQKTEDREMEHRVEVKGEENMGAEPRAAGGAGDGSGEVQKEGF